MNFQYHTPITSLFHLLFFNGTATTGIYTLSLHDSLPISHLPQSFLSFLTSAWPGNPLRDSALLADRKSTRLYSSHVEITYAVFCLTQKKKKANLTQSRRQTLNH